MNEISDATSAVAGAAAFEGLADGIVSAIAEMASLRTFAAGETVLSIGQFDGSEFLIVASGVLKVTRPDLSTGDVIIEKISGGQSFSLPQAVVEADPAQFSAATVSAEEESVVAFVDAEAFRALIGRKPTLMRRLMTYFAQGLAGEARGASEEAAPERRIFAALVQFVERDAVTAKWRIPKMPKHRELADRANVEEAAAANAVASLIQSGVARRDYPGLVIEDIGRLNKLAS